MLTYHTDLVGFTIILPGGIVLRSEDHILKIPDEHVKLFEKALNDTPILKHHLSPTSSTTKMSSFLPRGASIPQGNNMLDFTMKGGDITTAMKPSQEVPPLGKVPTKEVNAPGHKTSATSDKPVEIA